MRRIWVIIVGIAVILQIHNAKMFDPLYGFDGFGHIQYLDYIQEHHKLPLPHEGWQYYQTPLYYLLATPVYSVAGYQGVQLQNVIYYFLFLWIGGYLIANIIEGSKTRLVATLTLAALPVVNYLVPMISNEFLNDAIMGTVLLLMMAQPIGLGSIVLLVIGFYNKYTVLTLGPAVAVGIFSEKKIPWNRIVIYSSIFTILIAPIFLRNIYLYKTPLAMAESFFPFSGSSEARDINFFTNLSWITKLDLFQSHHYSFWGGTWNTFWHDGYQVSVPVVAFHKKAFILSLLGLPLLIFSIIGWNKLRNNNRRVFRIGICYIATALIAYILYNFHLPYPSELKAFFMSGLPVIYALGVASCYVSYPKLQRVILIILIIQFVLMLSYFWIQPWWYMVR